MKSSGSCYSNWKITRHIAEDATCSVPASTSTDHYITEEKWKNTDQGVSHPKKDLGQTNFSVCFYQGMTVRISKQYTGEYLDNRNGIKLWEKELEPDFLNPLHRKMMSEQPRMSGFYFLILQIALLASFTSISHWNEHRVSAYEFLNFTYIIFSESYLEYKKIFLIPIFLWYDMTTSPMFRIQEYPELFSRNVFTFF